MGIPSRSYEAITIDIENGVATIKLPGMTRRAAAIERGGRSNEYHPELATALSDLREDDDIRVVVLTGEEDGVFMTSGTAIPWLMENGPDRGFSRMTGMFDDFTGNIRHTQIMVEMEKPVIAKVNGHAWGPGASLMFASDLIVAAEDAVIGDSHMALDELEPMVKSRVVPPGDGGAVFAPLYLSPALAKEYMFFGKPFTGAQLAALGAINYAAPVDQLDGIVDGLVERLLKRPALAVGLTKRIANRRVAEHMNLTLDASVGYEALVMLQNSLKTTNGNAPSTPDAGAASA